jgi:hypothetical protein
MKSNSFNYDNEPEIVANPAQGTDEAAEALPPYRHPSNLYDPTDFGGAD